MEGLGNNEKYKRKSVTEIFYMQELFRFYEK